MFRLAWPTIACMRAQAHSKWPSSQYSCSMTVAISALKAVQRRCFSKAANDAVAPTGHGHTHHHHHGSPTALPAMWDLLYSISTGWKATGPPLSLGEMLWGARVLAKQQATSPREPRDSLQGTPVTDKHLLHHLLESLDLAAASYKMDKTAAAAVCKLKVHDMLVWRHEGSYLAPGYYLALDHGCQELVWVIRGTRHMSDLITDLSTAHPYQQAHTHWGMQQAAHWMLNKECHTVREVLRRYPGYRLHLTGHSMGGGVAALMAHMAHTQPHVTAQLLPHGNITINGVHQVHATCFATPCIMTREMAHSCRPYVVSVVLGDDLVPRLNAQTAAVLRADLRATDWRPKVASLLGLQQWYADQVKNVSAMVRPPVEALQDSLPAALTWRDDKQGSTATHQDSPRQDSLSRTKTTQGWVVEMFTALLQPFLPATQTPPLPPPQPGREHDGRDAALVASDGHGDAEFEAAMPSHALVVGSRDGGEADLGRWSHRWRQVVSLATQQLSDLRTAPLAAREAFFSALSSPGSDDLLKQIKLLLMVASSQGKPGSGDVPMLKSLASRLSSKLDDLPSLRALVSEVIAGKMKRSSITAGAAHPPTFAIPGNIVRSDGDDADVTMSSREQAPAEGSLAVLYPAGQLYFIERLEQGDVASGSSESVSIAALPQPEELLSPDGEPSWVPSPPTPRQQDAHTHSTQLASMHAQHGQVKHAVRVLAVSPDAPFFGRVLITRSAFRDHRSKSYRASLYAALDRELTQL